MLVRRLLLLLAVLIALTALAGSIAPVPGPAPQPGGTPTAGPEPTARQEAGAPADVRTVLSAAPRAAAQRVTARVGAHVVIIVRGTAIDSVALGEVDVKPVEPGIPARFDFLADQAGSYPIVLLDAGRRVGTLLVR